MTGRWKTSDYNVFVPLSTGRRLAYNAISEALAVWDAAEWALYEQARSSGRAELEDRRVRLLIEGGWLVREGVQELAAIERSYAGVRHEYQSMTLTIAPTMACNFGCDYCYQGAHKPGGSMGAEVQDGISRLVERVQGSIRRLHVAWYGGEPTLRMNIVNELSERLIRQCDAQRVVYDASMVTNGHRLDVACARELYERRVRSIQVTLDGAPDAHDARRHLLAGGGTFERIVENLAAVVSSVPIQFQIRVNIDERNAAGIPQLLERLSGGGLAHSQRLRVYFAPVESKTEGCHSVSDVMLGKQRYADLEAELHRQAFDLGLTGLPYPPRHKGVCAALKPRGFVIVPNGDVHKCWDTAAFPARRVGTIFDLEALNHDPRVQRWMEWSPFDNAACRNCRILPICGGFCAHKSLHAEASKGAASRLPCPSWKYNLKERLMLRAEKLGAVRAGEYDRQALRSDPSEMLIQPDGPGSIEPEVPDVPLRRGRGLSLPVIQPEQGL